MEGFPSWRMEKIPWCNLNDKQDKKNMSQTSHILE